MKEWTKEAVFYHIYPLGFCGCEQFHQTTTHHRIEKIEEWIPHLKQLHVNAVYLGPVFESYEHGYDTSDYRLIDRRLGTNADFRKVCDALHANGIRIVLDGVFNHVGRYFWAFEDVKRNREQSSYVNWFHNLNFGCDNPMHDGFTYDTWEGHYNLVKLNLHNEEVVQYLLGSIAMWMDDFGIDGLRLDAADCIEPAFFARLKQFCERKRADFWLMGEIIHGDYNRWANPEMLDSVTNYECYKGLYSSHNEKNYFEIAYSLNRQFGNGGMYKDLILYNFVDNHDVNRLASTLRDLRDVYNVYTLMYTMPGMPSIYYGSEFALPGTKHDGSDADIRPCLDLVQLQSQDTTLLKHLQKLGECRKKLSALSHGTYEQIVVRNQQFVFARTMDQERVYIVLNVSEDEAEIDFPVHTHQLFDVLHEEHYPCLEEHFIGAIPAKRAMILIAEQADESTHIEVNTVQREQTSMESNDTIVSEQKAPVEEATHTVHDSITACVKSPIPLGRYEHYKGNHYALLYVATHSETMEQFAVYRQLYGDGDVWIRPLSMFCETVIVEKKEVPRFRYIGK